MPVLFNRVAGVSQYAATPVDVPLHLLDEIQGTVKLWLRELPAGLAQEFDDQLKDANGDTLSVLREVARWGVAGHEPNDFLEQQADGSVTPILYKVDTATYHDKSWPVAHPETVALYEHALPKGMFLHSIRAALSWYQGGVVPTPRVLWDAAKPKETPRPLALSVAQAT